MIKHEGSWRRNKAQDRTNKLGGSGKSKGLEILMLKNRDSRNETMKKLRAGIRILEFYLSLLKWRCSRRRQVPEYDRAIDKRSIAQWLKAWALKPERISVISFIIYLHLAFVSSSHLINKIVVRIKIIYLKSFVQCPTHTKLSITDHF